MAIATWLSILFTVILVISLKESHCQDDKGFREMMTGIRFRTSRKLSDAMVRRPVVIPLRRPQLAPGNGAVREEGPIPTFAGHYRREDTTASREIPITFPDFSELFGQPPSFLTIQNETVVADEEANDTMDLPDDLNINNMDLNTMMMMSNVETVEDFGRIFGIDLPVDDGEGPTFPLALASVDADATATLRFGVGNTEVAEMAVSATCRPEEQTVRLDLPLELNVLYFPHCVRLQRCGGCCTGPLLECQPTEYLPITLKVIRIAASAPATRDAGNGRTRPRQTGRRRRRRRRQSSREHLVVQQHHTACACQCRVQAQHCEPALHDYLQTECRCRCKNGDEQSKCSGVPSTHYWNNDACACMCLKDEECSTGQYFDDVSCGCVAIPLHLRAGGFRGRAALDNGEVEDMLDGRPEHVPVIFGGN